MSANSGATWPDTPATSLVHDDVEEAVFDAVIEISESITGLDVLSWPDDSRGAFVVIDDVVLSNSWATERTWLGLRITCAYPEADAYPLYVRADLQRRDGSPLTSPFNVGHQFADRSAVMLSRSNPRKAKAASSAAVRIINTIEFLGTAS